MNCRLYVRPVSLRPDQVTASVVSLQALCEIKKNRRKIIRDVASSHRLAAYTLACGGLNKVDQASVLANRTDRHAKRARNREAVLYIKLIPEPPGPVV